MRIYILGTVDSGNSVNLSTDTNVKQTAITGNAAGGIFYEKGTIRANNNLTRNVSISVSGSARILADRGDIILTQFRSGGRAVYAAVKTAQASTIAIASGRINNTVTSNTDININGGAELINLLALS